MFICSKKNIGLFFALLISFTWSGGVSASESSSSYDNNDKKPLVLLISIDGFKPDYLNRGLTPSLNKLARDGSSAKGLIPPFPSLTFPSHYSEVTGLTPDHHGIVNNVIFDPEIPDQIFKLSSREAVVNFRR